jgi:hypothetical protein
MRFLFRHHAERLGVTVQENIPGTGLPVEIIHTGGAGQGKVFYRIVVDP